MTTSASDVDAVVGQATVTVSVRPVVLSSPRNGAMTCSFASPHRRKAMACRWSCSLTASDSPWMHTVRSLISGLHTASS